MYYLLDTLYSLGTAQAVVRRGRLFLGACAGFVLATPSCSFALVRFKRLPAALVER